MTVFGISEVGVVEVSLVAAPERRHHPHEPCFRHRIRSLVVIAFLFTIFWWYFFRVAWILVSTDHFGYFSMLCYERTKKTKIICKRFSSPRVNRSKHENSMQCEMHHLFGKIYNIIGRVADAGAGCARAQHSALQGRRGRNAHLLPLTGARVDRTFI